MAICVFNREIKQLKWRFSLILFNALKNYFFKALALCVEYAGNIDELNDTQNDYFNLENYLPGKFYDLKSGEILSIQREIIILHAQFSSKFCRLEAKERFIDLCIEEVFNNLN